MMVTVLRLLRGAWWYVLDHVEIRARPHAIVARHGSPSNELSMIPVSVMTLLTTTAFVKHGCFWTLCFCDLPGSLDLEAFTKLLLALD